jgi:hypothetical protein
MGKKNFFVYGLSGSGKDSVSNYLRDSYGFMKLRIADTIKRIICETKNLSFEQLEEQKRVQPELRTMHNDVSKMLDGIAGIEQSSLIRLKMLIDDTALDYQHLGSLENIQETQKIICDCRTYDEASMLLKAGWIGIFLSRTTTEFKDSTHFTEQNMFTNGKLKDLLSEYQNLQICLIFNERSLEKNIPDTYDSDQIYMYGTNGSLEMLEEVIYDLLCKTK